MQGGVLTNRISALIKKTLEGEKKEGRWGKMSQIFGDRGNTVVGGNRSSLQAGVCN